jgi:hypothetical protein
MEVYLGNISKRISLGFFSKNSAENTFYKK